MGVFMVFIFSIVAFLTLAIIPASEQMELKSKALVPELIFSENDEVKRVKRSNPPAASCGTCTTQGKKNYWESSVTKKTFISYPNMVVTWACAHTCCASLGYRLAQLESPAVFSWMKNLSMISNTGAWITMYGQSADSYYWYSDSTTPGPGPLTISSVCAVCDVASTWTTAGGPVLVRNDTTTGRLRLENKLDTTTAPVICDDCPSSATCVAAGSPTVATTTTTTTTTSTTSTTTTTIPLTTTTTTMPLTTTTVSTSTSSTVPTSTVPTSTSTIQAPSTTTIATTSTISSTVPQTTTTASTSTLSHTVTTPTIPTSASTVETQAMTTSVVTSTSSSTVPQPTTIAATSTSSTEPASTLATSSTVPFSSTEITISTETTGITAPQTTPATTQVNLASTSESISSSSSSTPMSTSTIPQSVATESTSQGSMTETTAALTSTSSYISSVIPSTILTTETSVTSTVPQTSILTSANAATSGTTTTSAAMTTSGNIASSTFAMQTSMATESPSSSSSSIQVSPTAFPSSSTAESTSLSTIFEAMPPSTPTSSQTSSPIMSTILTTQASPGTAPSSMASMVSPDSLSTSSMIAVSPQTIVVSASSAAASKSMPISDKIGPSAIITSTVGPTIFDSSTVDLRSSAITISDQSGQAASQIMVMVLTSTNPVPSASTTSRPKLIAKTKPPTSASPAPISNVFDAASIEPQTIASAEPIAVVNAAMLAIDPSIPNLIQTTSSTAAGTEAGSPERSSDLESIESISSMLEFASPESPSALPTANSVTNIMSMDTSTYKSEVVSTDLTTGFSTKRTAKTKPPGMVVHSFSDYHVSIDSVTNPLDSTPFTADQTGSPEDLVNTADHSQQESISTFVPFLESGPSGSPEPTAPGSGNAPSDTMTDIPKADHETTNAMDATNNDFAMNAADPNSEFAFLFMPGQNLNREVPTSDKSDSIVTDTTAPASDLTNLGSSTKQKIQAKTKPPGTFTPNPNQIDSPESIISIIPIPSANADELSATSKTESMHPSPDISTVMVPPTENISDLLVITSKESTPSKAESMDSSPAIPSVIKNALQNNLGQLAMTTLANADNPVQTDGNKNTVAGHLGSDTDNSESDRPAVTPSGPTGGPSLDADSKHHDLATDGLLHEGKITGSDKDTDNDGRPDPLIDNKTSSGPVEPDPNLNGMATIADTLATNGKAISPDPGTKTGMDAMSNNPTQGSLSMPKGLDNSRENMIPSDQGSTDRTPTYSKITAAVITAANSEPMQNTTDNKPNTKYDSPNGSPNDTNSNYGRPDPTGNPQLGYNMIANTPITGPNTQVANPGSENGHSGPGDTPVPRNTSRSSTDPSGSSHDPRNGFPNDNNPNDSESDPVGSSQPGYNKLVAAPSNGLNNNIADPIAKSDHPDPHDESLLRNTTGSLTKPSTNKNNIHAPRNGFPNETNPQDVGSTPVDGSQPGDDKVGSAPSIGPQIQVANPAFKTDHPDPHDASVIWSTTGYPSDNKNDPRNGFPISKYPNEGGSAPLGDSQPGYDKLVSGPSTSPSSNVADPTRKTANPNPNGMDHTAAPKFSTTYTQATIGRNSGKDNLADSDPKNTRDGHDPLSPKPLTSDGLSDMVEVSKNGSNGNTDQRDKMAKSMVANANNLEDFCSWSPWSACTATCGNAIRSRAKSQNLKNSQWNFTCASETQHAECKKLPKCNPMSDVEIMARDIMMDIGCTWVVVGTAMSAVASLLLKNRNYLQLIHLNQDISTFLAHICMRFFAMRNDDLYSHDACRAAALALQYFFTVSFLFQTIEAMHIYTVLCDVVMVNEVLIPIKKVLLLSWVTPAIITGVTVTVAYDRLMSDFSCWINAGDRVMLATFVPVVALAYPAIILLEATGKGTTKSKAAVVTSCRLAHAGLLLVFGANFAAWVMASSAIYYQHIALFTIVFGTNVAVGVLFFVYHFFANEKVRVAMKRLYRWIRNKRNTKGRQ